MVIQQKLQVQQLALAIRWRDQDKKEGEGRATKGRGRSRSLAESSRKSCDSGPPKAHSVSAPLLFVIGGERPFQKARHNSSSQTSHRVSVFQEERGWRSRAKCYCSVGDGLDLVQSLFMDLTGAGSKA